jgi:hypothetical protein
MSGPVARTALDRGFVGQIQLDCRVASIDQALLIRNVEEQFGHMDAVEEEFVAGHIGLAEHHMFDAQTGRKESVVEGIAAHNMEPGQVHLQLGKVLHMQSDGYVARAYQQRKSICCYYPQTPPRTGEETQALDSQSAGKLPQSCYRMIWHRLAGEFGCFANWSSELDAELGNYQWPRCLPQILQYLQEVGYY